MQMPNHSCIITDNESSDEDFMGQNYLPVIYERGDKLDHAIIAVQPLMVQKWPVFYIYIQIVFVIILSCLCHGIIFQTIYGAVDQHNALENSSQIITMKIPKASYYIEPPEWDKAHKKKSIKKKKSVHKKRKAHIRQLQSIGKQAKQNGYCPGLTISYENPQQYIKDMYELGAITFLYNKKKQTYYEVDLFKHTLIKKNPAHLQGYSRFIRVITDFCWDIQKQQYASQLHTSYDHLKLYLIIPEKLENLWLGHQLKLFQQHGIEQKDIINVTARFANKKLKLTSVNMAAGTKIIKDISGI